MKDIKQYILERDANTLPARITVDDDKEKGILKVSFGKNGWGLSNEFSQIGEIVQEYSRQNNIYIRKCIIDELDDVYDIEFTYSNKHFND
jgi:hypothetical protein